MKITKYITAFAAIAMMAMSCSTDVDEPQVGNPEQFVAPVINNMSDIIVNADNSKTENVIFTWKAADFGLPVQIIYSVYIGVDSETSLLGTSFTGSFSISKADFNGVVVNGLGIPANETSDITAYVTARMNGSDQYEEISSNRTNSFSVTTFAASLSWLYLCGEFNDWTIGEAPVFWETIAGTNIFKCMVDFTQKNTTPTDPDRSYFKVTAEQSWDGDNWGYNGLTPSWENPEQNDENLSLDLSEGIIFEITVNKAVMTIDKKAIGSKLSLVGTFNDWGTEDDALFKYDCLESAWLTDELEFVAGEEIKIRVDAPLWETNWGDSGNTSAEINGGIELESGKGNIKVSQAGTYRVKIHANRSPYVLELINQ